MCHFDNWGFDNLIAAVELFENDSPRFATCLLVNNNLWGKFLSLSPILFDDNLNNETTSVSFYIADFNLLSFEFDSFTFKLLYCVIFILTEIKPFMILHSMNLHSQNFYGSLWKFKTVSFKSWRMK